MPEGQEKFLELATEKWSDCEEITEKKDPLPTADEKRKSLGL